MRIDCPACSAAYDVPLERLAAGRAVKCVRCAHTWTPLPLPPPAATAAPEAPPPEPPAPLPVAEHEPEPAEAEPAAADEPTPERSPEAGPHPLLQPEPQRRRSAAPLVLAWLVTAAVLAGLGWLAIEQRGAVTRAWPPSLRAYALLDRLTQPAAH